MLTQPPWIVLDDEERGHLSYVWDDTRAMLDFKGDPAPVVRASMQMSLRARMVLCVGLYEWAVWRFSGLHQRTEPVEIAEAAWCAAVDPRYMAFFELTRSEWLGPIEGPLWCAAMWLQPAMSKGHMFPRSVYDALDFLTRLVLHVLPVPARFQSWSEIILRRLIETFPVVPEDPFDDLFDRNIGRRLGPLIGRNALDPTQPYTPEVGRAFLAHVLHDAAATENPFLASPGELKDSGFTDRPYILPG
jgi:hypothetical protein